MVERVAEREEEILADKERQRDRETKRDRGERDR